MASLGPNGFKLTSHKIPFFHNIYFNCPIVLKISISFLRVPLFTRPFVTRSKAKHPIIYANGAVPFSLIVQTVSRIMPYHFCAMCHSYLVLGCFFHHILSVDRINLAILVRVASAVIGKSYDSNYVSKATLNDMGKNWPTQNHRTQVYALIILGALLTKP